MTALALIRNSPSVLMFRSIKRKLELSLSTLGNRGEPDLDIGRGVVAPNALLPVAYGTSISGAIRRSL